MRVPCLVVSALAAVALAALAGCSSNGSSSSTPLTVQASSGCTVGAGGLCSFAPPADPGAGGILFAASGEVLALTGYAFPPVNTGDPAFVDGWEVHFTRLLTTIDTITLSDNPDKSPGDQSQTGGRLATIEGPWAVDLAHSDPSYLPGKGGPGEEAAQIAALGKDSRFATDGTRYAFGFEVIKATTQTADGRHTLNVNIDAPGLTDYEEMIQNLCAVFYVGTATFKGGSVGGFENCNADPEFSTWPTTVNFRLCFKTPTTYVNCQNPDNKGMPFANEESQRGIQFNASQSVIGQVTLHTDHPFWDSVLHDSPAHFDQFAARGVGQGATATVTLEDTKGVDYTDYTDSQGRKLSWRYCIAPPTDVHPQFTGAMAFDPQNVPPCVSMNRKSGLCDYYDYSSYNQSTQGHLNSNGLCFVARQYDSPP